MAQHDRAWQNDDEGARGKMLKEAKREARRGAGAAVQTRPSRCPSHVTTRRSRQQIGRRLGRPVLARTDVRRWAPRDVISLARSRRRRREVGYVVVIATGWARADVVTATGYCRWRIRGGPAGAWARWPVAAPTAFVRRQRVYTMSAATGQVNVKPVQRPPIIQPQSASTIIIITVDDAVLALWLWQLAQQAAGPREANQLTLKRFVGEHDAPSCLDDARRVE